MYFVLTVTTHYHNRKECFDCSISMYIYPQEVDVINMTVRQFDVIALMYIHKSNNSCQKVVDMIFLSQKPSMMLYPVCLELLKILYHILLTSLMFSMSKSRTFLRTYVLTYIKVGDIIVQYMEEERKTQQQFYKSHSEQG